MEYTWILALFILACTQLFVGGDKQQNKPTSFLNAQGNQNPIHQLLVKPPKINVSTLVGKNDLEKQETLQEFLAKITESWSQQKAANNPLETNKKDE